MNAIRNLRRRVNAVRFRRPAATAPPPAVPETPETPETPTMADAADATVVTDPVLADQPDDTELADRPEPDGDRVPARRRTQAVTALIVLVVLLAVGLAQTRSGRRLTASIGVSAPAERFTELYFAQPETVGRLPLDFNRELRRTTVSFVIGNRTRRQAAYRWSIRVGSSSGPSGSIVVTAGHTGMIRRSVSVPCAAIAAQPTGQTQSGVRIQVSLDTPPESIAYSQACFA